MSPSNSLLPRSFSTAAAKQVNLKLLILTKIPKQVGVVRERERERERERNSLWGTVTVFHASPSPWCTLYSDYSSWILDPGDLEQTSQSRGNCLHGGVDKRHRSSKRIKISQMYHTSLHYPFFKCNPQLLSMC